MPARQPDAPNFNPNTLELTCVAEYSRTISAGVERVWENVLDWEHLPVLHATSFDHVELDEAGDWGWRTWSDAGHRDYIELCVASGRSYVARSYVEKRQVSEIWTWLTPNGTSTDIRVEFHLTDVVPEKADRLGQRMLRLYEQLWNEDEAMMVRRQQRLDEHRSAALEIDLGSSEDLVSRLPLTFQLGRGEYVVREVGGTLVVYSAICPHRLGPLSDGEIDAGIVTCPWHGYRFNVDSGMCVWPARAKCTLGRKPTIAIEHGSVVARL